MISSKKYYKDHLACPSVEQKNLNYTQSGKYVNMPDDGGFFSLSVNINIVRGTAYTDGKTPLRVSRIKEPSKLVCYTDGNGQGGTGAFCSWHPDANKGETQNLPARHKGGGNFSYMDGHVAFLKWEKYPSAWYGYSTSSPIWKP